MGHGVASTSIHLLSPCLPGADTAGWPEQGSKTAQFYGPVLGTARRSQVSRSH
jgi:hypothetical protein